MPPVFSVGLRKVSMSVRIRVLLLAIAAALYPGETASACPGCLLLSPFRWLFGCDQYHGCGLVNPHNCNRVIDDWLGYGYLRNQQGTLGHYPGNWYRQIHPQHSMGWQGGGAIAGGYGMVQPAMAPLPQPMMMPMPMPAGPIYSGSWDPCCEMSGPMMSGAVWGGECCDPCGGGAVTYGVPAAPQMMYEGSSGGDCGCSGGSGGTLMTPPSVPPAGMFEQPVPMSWQSGGVGVMASYSGQPGYPVYTGYPSGMPSMSAPWTPTTAWQAQPMQPHWPVPQLQAQQYSQSWQSQPLYARNVYAQNQYAQQWQAQQWQAQQLQAQQWQAQQWQAQQLQAQQWQAQQLQAQQWQAQQWRAQQLPVQPWAGQPMEVQVVPAQRWSPVVQMDAQWSGADGGNVGGPAPAIGGSARLPLRRVSLSSPPLGSVGTRSYPNALR
jgi:hypothetical protein